MTTSDNYYAVRANAPCPHHDEDSFCTVCAGVGYHKARSWDVVMVIQCHSFRFDGLYRLPNDDRRWLSRITFEEFDMLLAFGVDYVYGMTYDMRTMRGDKEADLLNPIGLELLVI